MEMSKNSDCPDININAVSLLLKCVSVSICFDFNCFIKYYDLQKMFYHHRNLTCLWRCNLLFFCNVMLFFKFRDAKQMYL